MTAKSLRLPKNEHGRDYIVGDIHFKTRDLHRGLVALGFDSSVDRVIGVGDLIDRGSGVLDGLKLLGEPWFFAVMGNHEEMLIKAYRANPNAPYTANGAGWWATIDDDSKNMIITRLESLPLAIEIEVDQGIVGVVHADVPAGMAWQDFLNDLRWARTADVALWGRERIFKHDRSGVQGVWRVCTGHTSVPTPIRLGNVLALDCTGGGEGPLGIYCPQNDTIYVAGKPAALDQAGVITEGLSRLEDLAEALKGQIGRNHLIESKSLSKEVGALVRSTNTQWLSMQDDLVESQRFINVLHGLSFLSGDRKKAKLEEIRARYAGTQIGMLLERLFD